MRKTILAAAILTASVAPTDAWARPIITIPPSTIFAICDALIPPTPTPGTPSTAYLIRRALHSAICGYV